MEIMGRNHAMKLMLSKTSRPESGIKQLLVKFTKGLIVRFRRGSQ
jgi:hypothetical protein